MVSNAVSAHSKRMVSLLVLHFAGSDHTIVDGQEVFKLTVFSHFVIDMFNTIRVKKSPIKHKPTDSN